jgi:Zn-dependent protease with chaperone function
VTPVEQWLTAALGITWGGLGLSFAVGKWARGRETAADAILYRVEQLERRMERAGEKMSDLANEVQAMPERLRHEFVLRAEWALTERRKSE